MRLRRLSLTNWRGVRSREVEFSDTVTLVEGPNEIGKSTIIEALQMLFRELDSSNKKQIKAIMPVGEDVGSRVEVELTAGDYHFVYAKTYNRDKQTTLHILTPQVQQLSGREAHEEATRMLEETVDLALWEALLIDQGAKVGLADLTSSSGLAQALDEAAGNTGQTRQSAIADEDSLHTRVQLEYEKYFTPTTGKPKPGYNQVIENFQSAQADLTHIRDAISEVEDIARSQQLQTAEVERLTAALPELETSLRAADSRWQQAQALNGQIAEVTKAMDQAHTIQTEAERALKTRQQLIRNIADSEQKLATETRQQDPLLEELQSRKAAVAAAKAEVEQCKATQQQARRTLELAITDEKYLQNLDLLGRERSRLKVLEDNTAEMKLQLAITATIKVDDAALSRFRTADANLAIARSRQDAAATTVSVRASQPLQVELDDDTIRLAENESHSRAVASRLNIRIPDIADITVSPSLSVNELAAETEQAQVQLAALASEYQVDSLEGAIAAHQKRADAQRVVEQLKAREEEILRNANIEEIRQQISSLSTDCEDYARSRITPPDLPLDLPESVTQAADRVAACRTSLSHCEQALEAAREQADQADQTCTELDQRVRRTQQELAGLQAALTDRQHTLDQARTERTDQQLEEQVANARRNHTEVAAALENLQQRLAAEDPEAAKILLDNAGGALKRAQSDLFEVQKKLAVSSDRLAQARVNGRFEEMETAERTLAIAQAELESTQRRADAAALLWNTLNRHRDAARIAYVRPLKEAIERLGSIVFGSGFEVTIDEDWSIASRTLNGRTLPFDDLSVGAREQLGILTRLAAARIVSTEGGVPLIIDDALGFSDPSRLETMGAAIAAAGHNAQIIILTCTPGRFMHVGNARLVKFEDAYDEKNR